MYSSKALLSTFVLTTGCCLNAAAQYSFTFEDADVPKAWAAQQGTLSLSSEHSTEGTQSLCWEVPANTKAVLKVSFSTAYRASSLAAIFDIYSLDATDERLTIEFNSSSSTQLTANVTMNFKGWRNFNRVYGEDFESKASKAFTDITFTLDNSTNTKPQCIFFDKVNFRGASDDSRVMLDLMCEDLPYLNVGTDLLSLYANEADIQLVEPTQDELDAIETIRAKYPYSPTPAESSSVLDDIRQVVSDLNIIRNNDGTVKGNAIISATSELTQARERELLVQLNALAASTDDGDDILFANYIDLIIDQGVFYRFGQLPSNNYSVVREYPKLLLQLLPKCTVDQQVEVLKMVRWIAEVGWAYASTDYIATEFSSDIIYNFFTHFISYAAYQPDKAVAVRELKAMSRLLERVLKPVNGGYDTIKPDWVGFHHGTHYNNYMYCYNGWLDAACNLMSTPFKVSSTAFEYIKNAVLACYTMSNRSDSGANYYANSLAGRHPFDGGQINQFGKANFERLIELSVDICGVADDELMAAYNYFFLTDKYAVADADYRGFYQFNYSPIGIYRGDDWVVTMRAPTTRMWGAEIYSGTSRFSRYQSHGTMEVVYNGDLTNSGLPLVPRGYDWNVAPGSTTVHYTSWNEMMPKQNTTQRFDQFTATKDFSGALTWGDCGIFACDFDQIDKWGSECFTPTNLVFKKSVYAFDDMLISLGSNISSPGNYSDDRVTATNLFQEVGDDMGDVVLSSGRFAAGTGETTLSDNTWLLTPKGTGYYIPRGNDNITLKYGMQEGPDEDGSDVNSPTKAMAAKAYISHGIKPTDASYCFVMKPHASVADMEDIAAKVGDDGGEMFSILSQTDKFHALTFKPDSITAYAFFEAVDDTGLNVVKSTESEMLVMHQIQADGSLRIAVCNPNLEVQSVSSSLGDWFSGETKSSVTLIGEWYESESVDNVMVNAPIDGLTKIDLVMKDGLPINFRLQSKSNNSIASTFAESDDIRVTRIANSLVVSLDKSVTESTAVKLFATDGKLLVQTYFAIGAREAKLDIPAELHGVTLLVVVGENIAKSIKVSL